METQKKSIRKQPMKYWLVDITLTSGEVLQFYVKARTQQFAYEKADEYAFIAEHSAKLRSTMKEFKLLP